MTIDGEAGGPEDASDDFVSGNNVASMIYAIDRTEPTSSEESATTAGYVHRAVDDDTSGLGETEVNPLLAGTNGQSATIDASIGKPRGTTDKVVETRTVRTMDNIKNRCSNGPEEGALANELTTPTTAAAAPPDGGLRAWMIMIGSFAINGVLFSIINTYSLIYMELQRRLTEAGESEVSSKAALVGSLTIGTTFFLSPVAGILTDKFGIQMTTFVGGAIASGGLLLSSMLTDKVELLYLTYGVMYGLGASLAYTPSLVILGHYFKKYMGLVNGIVTAGSSIFTTLIPYLIEFLLRRFGLEGTLRSLAVLTALIMACAVLFKPIPVNVPQEDERPKSKAKLRNCMKEIVNVSIWKRKRYVLWASSIPLALFGYFVPYVHIGKFVAMTFKDADGKLPVMCIGITSGIGRLIFGYIADLPKVNRILLQQISFISIGILTMLLPVTKSFVVLLIISLGMGLFDGCFISLLGPIAFDICGRSGATQAIGFLLGMCSIPLTVGPPIAGLLYDHTGSYDLPFLLAGIPPIVGALTMFLIRCVKEDVDRSQTCDPCPENPPSKTDCQNEKVKSKDFSSKFIADVKEEGASEAQDKYRTFSKNSQLPWYNQDIKQAELGHCITYKSNDKCNVCYRYSESTPLLHQERSSQYPSTSLFKQTMRSDYSLHSAGYCKFSESVPLLCDTSVSRYPCTSLFERTT